MLTASSAVKLFTGDFYFQKSPFHDWRPVVLQRNVFQTPVLMALAGFVLVMLAPSARADVEKCFQLRVANYELRCAKEQIRALDDSAEFFGGGGKVRKEKMLGACENAITTLKKAYEAATGMEMKYDKPVIDKGDPFHNIRVGVKALRTAKKEVKAAEIDPGLKAKCEEAISNAIEQLDKGLETIKK